MTELQTQYDHLYLSPHFDDVSLSCGGQIYRHTAIGDTVLVVTLTAGEPPAGYQSDIVVNLHRRWSDGLDQEPESMVVQRQGEDREAFAVLRADVLHLPFRDCIYRPGADGAPLYPGPTDMFGAFNPADAGFVDEVASALAALPPADRVYLPLGVGGHIDHGVTRRAGERVFANPGFYEDYPYTMAPGALEAVLPPATRSEWRPETIWLTNAALEAKITSISAYHSQLSSFFTGPEDLAAKLLAEAQRVMTDALVDGEVAPDWAVGAERLWWR